ncbi:MAG: AAC(3) family N-acetyltransferase [Nanoarchaeota archaeon]
MQSKVRESNLKRRLKSHLPLGIQKILYSLIKKIRLTKNIAKGQFAKKHIKKFLLNAGLKKGDVVIVHSSLGRIGYIEGGADTIIDAFLDVIGKQGTLVMPTHSNPEFNKEKGMYVFNAKKTPAYTGKIPETFRLRKGVRRSLAPMHSVAAYGNKSEWLVEAHEKCDNPYAMNSPYGKLHTLDAKIFQIGVDQLANSCIHIVEDKIKFPIKVFTDKLSALIIDENGKKKIINFRRHLPHLYKIRNNNMIEKHLLENNMIKIYPFGNTELRVHKVRDLVHLMEKLAKKGVTIYNS